jgi:sugar transferase (PEP-CTERM/EpsH1 system associated)
VRILYICHRFPYPPKRGGTIRPFNMIKHLHASGHEVVVCSLTRSPELTRDAQGIAPHCTEFHAVEVDNRIQALRMVGSLPTPLTASASFFYSGRLARIIRRLLAEQKFDLIFVHCSSVAHYVDRVQGIAKILDFGDMDSQKWLEYARHKPFPLSLGYWWEGIRLRADEKRLARRFDLCTTITRAECQTLIDYGTGVPTDWFPNGVDNGFFAPATEPHDPETIAFVGRMDYFPNQQCMLDFCRDTLPLLKAKRPGIRLTIVGADPSPAILALGEIDGVTVTGSVPDVRPFVTKAALTVAPLRIARGTQNKILEAMAMGIPVVCSSIAAGGVDAIPGEHFLTADTPVDTAAAILRVLDDPTLRDRLAKDGRERVLNNHAWSSSMRRLDAIIERCLASRVSITPLQAQIT